LGTTCPHGAEGPYRHQHGQLVLAERLLENVWIHFIATGSDHKIHDELQPAASSNHAKEESCWNPEISMLPLKENDSEDMILFELLNEAAKHGCSASHEQ
jgi:hypothetical protein